MSYHIIYHTIPYQTTPYRTILYYIILPNETTTHSPQHTLPHFTSLHLNTPHITHLILPHLTLRRHNSIHLTSPHLNTPHYHSPYLTTPHIFMFSLVINTSCPRAKAERINWPRENFGVLSVQKCPYGAQGTARRLCAFGKGWQDPDLSNCTSRGFVDIVKSVSFSRYHNSSP